MKNPKYIIFVIILALLNHIPACAEEIQLTDYRYKYMQYMFNGYTLAYDMALMQSSSGAAYPDTFHVVCGYDRKSNEIVKPDGTLFYVSDGSYDFDYQLCSFNDSGDSHGSGYRLEQYYPQGADGHTFVVHEKATDKCALMNSEGKFVTGFDYYRLHPLGKNFFGFSRTADAGATHGLLDKDGNVLAESSGVIYLCENGEDFLTAEPDAKLTYYNKDGEVTDTENKKAFCADVDVASLNDAAGNNSLV